MDGAAAGKGRLLVLSAFLFAALVLLTRLGGLPLLQPDEGRNAEIAREMREAGSWLVPTYDGVPYLDKPAFYFRAVALSFSVLGNSEFAARLPSALFALALLALSISSAGVSTGRGAPHSPWPLSRPPLCFSPLRES